MAKFILAIVLFLQGCVTTNNNIRNEAECTQFVNVGLIDGMAAIGVFVGEDRYDHSIGMMYVDRQDPSIIHTVFFARQELEKIDEGIHLTPLAHCYGMFNTGVKHDLYIYGVTVQLGDDDIKTLEWVGPIYE